MNCKNCEFFKENFCNNKNGFTLGGFVQETDFCSRWLPKVDRGAWKEIGENKYECSVCGMVVEGNEEDLNLCPKCGAKMVEIFWRREWTNTGAVTSAKLNTSEGISL